MLTALFARSLQSAAAVAVLALAGQQAQATLLTFNELPWTPHDSWSDLPVTSQYASLGVTMQGAYLDRNDAGNQYLITDIFGTISFTDTLPRYVSLNLSSPSAGTESYVEAWNGNTLVGSGRTGGVFPDGSADGGSSSVMPYEANRYIPLTFAGGISRLTFANAYGTRTSALVDNLYFGAVPAVPEPSTLLLFGAGIPLLVAVARRRKNADS